jgi:hypothetical protein
VDLSFFAGVSVARGLAVVAVVALLPACSHDAERTPDADAPVSTTAAGPPGAAGVVLEAPPDAFGAGVAVHVTERSAPDELTDLLVGPVVEVAADGGAQPARSVTLRFPAPPADAGPTHIAYRDEVSGWWLPVGTTVDAGTGERRAVVDHLSSWGQIRDRVIDRAAQAPGWLQSSASWLEYQGGRALGNRAGRPDCGRRLLPDWVSGPINMVEDPNAELFVCGRADGDDLVLELANNRGYPVMVEFSAPFASSSTNLPTTLADVVHRIGNPGSPTRVFLTGTGTGVVRFTRPPRSGVIDGHVRRDGGVMLSSFLFDLLSVAGADLPVGGGKTLGLSTVECYAALYPTVEAAAEAVRTRSPSAAAGAVGGLRGCAGNIVDGELARAAPGSATAGRLGAAQRWLKAVAVWDFVQDAGDAFINDGTKEAALVDVSFLVKVASAGLDPHGLDTDGPAPLRFGDPIARGEQVTGVRARPCDMAGSIVGYVIEPRPGVYLDFHQGRLDLLYATSDQLSTRSGGHVGMAVDELARRMPTGVRTDVYGRPVFVVRSGPNSVVFWLDDAGRATQITAGPSARAEDVSEC